MPRMRKPPADQAAAEALAKIGRRLKIMRTAANLTQGEVCERLGVDQGSWSRWEKGQKRPDLAYMVNFADRFQASLDFIYLGRPQGVHPGLLLHIRAEQPDLISEAPPGTDHDTDKALTSYRASILPN